MSPFLSKTDVHLWRIETDDSAHASFAESLSIDERRRAACYRSAEQRSSYVLTRFALRNLLARYVEMPADVLRFEYGVHGKPVLAGGPQFNLSRSSGIALICIAGVPCGVDVERIDRDFHWQGIGHHFLSSAEQSHIQESALESGAEAFFRCWTRREAYCKARGVGLASAEAQCSLADRVNDEEGRTWSLLSMTRFGGFAAALCVNSLEFKVSYFDWSSASAIGATSTLQSSHL